MFDHYSSVLRLQFGANGPGGSDISGVEKFDHDTQTPTEADEHLRPVEIRRDVTDGGRRKIL